MEDKRKGFTSTLFSSPERGTGGKAGYRGNCCPGIIEAFITQYGMKYLSDYAVGGGTTKDVCERMGVKGFWTDLRLGFDLTKDEIPDIPENIFYHPPYWNMNGKIVYSNTEYDWREVKERYGYDPRESDLSQIADWEQFLRKLNQTVMKQYAALERGGRMGILMGDIKKKGRLYSMLFGIAKPGTVEQVVIKQQYHCTSDRIAYRSDAFIPLAHEYLLILRKELPFTLDYQITRTVRLSMQDSLSVTWKDVVAAVLKEEGNISLQELYTCVEGFKKCKGNPFWKEKIRQTLYRYNCFSKKESGCWALCA